MKARTLTAFLALALSGSAACLASSWEKGVVRDVDDNGKIVRVHADASFREKGGVRQVFAIESDGRLIYAQRNEGWRWTHACEVPVDANVAIRTKGGHMEMRDAQGDLYHFKVVKVEDASAANLAPLRTADPDRDGTEMSVSRVIVIPQ